MLDLMDLVQEGSYYILTSLYCTCLWNKKKNVWENGVEDVAAAPWGRTLYWAIFGQWESIKAPHGVGDAAGSWFM